MALLFARAYAGFSFNGEIAGTEKYPRHREISPFGLEERVDELARSLAGEFS